MGGWVMDGWVGDGWVGDGWVGDGWVMGGWSRQPARPADVLVPNWILSKIAAFDLSVTSTLNTQVFQEVSVTAGSVALAAQIRKHGLNDESCMQGTRLGMYPSCGGDIWMLGY